MNNINIVNNTKQLSRRSKHLWASWNWFVTAARLCWSPKAADGMGENGKPLSPMALEKKLAIGHQKYVSRKHKNKTKMVMTGDGWGSLVWDHGIRFFSIGSRRPWRDHRMTILTLIRFLAAFFKLLWWRPCQRELQPWRPRGTRQKWQKHTRSPSEFIGYDWICNRQWAYINVLHFCIPNVWSFEKGRVDRVLISCQDFSYSKGALFDTFIAPLAALEKTSVRQF